MALRDLKPDLLRRQVLLNTKRTLTDVQLENAINSKVAEGSSYLELPYPSVPAPPPDLSYLLGPKTLTPLQRQTLRESGFVLDETLPGRVKISWMNDDGSIL